MGVSQNVFEYLYDAASNVTRRTLPDGTVSDYTFNDEGRMASVATAGATTSYGYDVAANLTSTTLPSGNGHVETRTYDRAGRLTEVRNTKGGNTLSRETLTLDEVGNPTSAVTQTGTTTYAYDALDRITQACYTPPTCTGSGDFLSYAYDAVGNRTAETRAAGSTTYVYNNADQLTSQSGANGAKSFTYDANGNQTTAGSNIFTYNTAGKTKTIKVGSTTTTYTYDGDGKRTEGSTGSQASKKTRYLWDRNAGLPLLSLERDGNNALVRRYQYGNDLVSMVSGGSSYYYHYDTLGSVKNLTSSTGAAQWTYGYDPFGKLRSEVKNNNGAPTNLMRYTGELFDSGTGLYHLRARQYDPAIGRFTQTDPVPPQITDPYVAAYIYANNRPTLLVDPSGLFPWGSFFRWTGLIAGSLATAALIPGIGIPAVVGQIGGLVALSASVGNAYYQCTSAPGAACSNALTGLSLNLAGTGVLSSMKGLSDAMRASFAGAFYLTYWLERPCLKCR